MVFTKISSFSDLFSSLHFFLHLVIKTVSDSHSIENELATIAIRTGDTRVYGSMVHEGESLRSPDGISRASPGVVEC